MALTAWSEPLAAEGRIDSGGGIHLLALAAAMNIFLPALDDVPDPHAENARHDLGELLVIALISVLCGATRCAEMAAFGLAQGQGRDRECTAITHGCSDYSRRKRLCIAPKANHESPLSDARSCFSRAKANHPVARQQEPGHGHKEIRTGLVVSVKGLAEHYEILGLKAFGRIESQREPCDKIQTETCYFALAWMPESAVFMAAVRAHCGIENALRPLLKT